MELFLSLSRSRMEYIKDDGTKATTLQSTFDVDTGDIFLTVSTLLYIIRMYIGLARTFRFKLTK